jgi:hypothetical protein
MMPAIRERRADIRDGPFQSAHAMQRRNRPARDDDIHVGNGGAGFSLQECDGRLKPALPEKRFTLLLPTPIPSPPFSRKWRAP